MQAPRSFWQWFRSLWVPPPPAPIEILEAQDLYNARTTLLESSKELEYHRAIVAAMQARIARLTTKPLVQQQSTEEGKSNDN